MDYSRPPIVQGQSRITPSPYMGAHDPHAYPPAYLPVASPYSAASASPSPAPPAPPSYPPSASQHHFYPSHQSQQPSAPQQDPRMAYQGRRDQRHSLNPPVYGYSVPHPDGGHAAPSRAAIPPGSQYHRNTRPQMGRRGSSASSATEHPMKPSDPVDKEGLPEGWTQEDEEAERAFRAEQMFDWDKMRDWRFWLRREWIWYYVLLVVILVLVALMSIFHDEIVKWLTPATNWMRNLTAGWVIPIVILFVISFPPLFGHEIVTILVGVVWGLWKGFGIVAAGTLAGEIGNFYAFKYFLRGHAEKYERDSINYACLCYVVRQGGFFMIFLIRLSAIPGHFSTAVFSTCGITFIPFTLACILSMPKQLAIVYLGVIFASDTKSKKGKIISDTVLGIGIVVTLGAAWYIWREMQKARVPVWREQRMKAKALGTLGAQSIPKIEANKKEYLHDPSDPDASSPILLSHPNTGSSPSPARPQRPARRPSDAYVDPYDQSPLRSGRATRQEEPYETRIPLSSRREERMERQGVSERHERQKTGGLEEADLGYGAREGGVRWPEARPVQPSGHAHGRRSGGYGAQQQQPDWNGAASSAMYRQA